MINLDLLFAPSVGAVTLLGYSAIGAGAVTISVASTALLGVVAVDIVGRSR